MGYKDFKDFNLVFIIDSNTFCLYVCKNNKYLINPGMVGGERFSNNLTRWYPVVICVCCIELATSSRDGGNDWEKIIGFCNRVSNSIGSTA